MARRRTPYLPLMIAAPVLGACVVALLVAFSGEKAEASFPGKNGRIAHQGSDGVIYTINPINPTGGEKTKVRRGDHPSYSPDGTKIAYACSDGKTARSLYGRGSRGEAIRHRHVSDDFHPATHPTAKSLLVLRGHDLEICT